MADDKINGAASDWLFIAHNAYETSTNYFNAGVRREVEQDLRQFQGLHPSGSKYLSDSYKARSRFFRPKTRSAIRKNEAVAAAALFSNVDVVEVMAWDDSDATQRGSASLLKELMNLRLRRTIPWFLISIGAYQDAQTVGLCCSYQYWDYNPKKRKDGPCIKLVPIENIRFDPAAHWTDVVGTSPYLIEKIPMYVKDVRARMSRNMKTGEQRWDTVTDAQILLAVQGYSDSIRLQREAGRADSQASATALTPYQIVWVHRNIADIDGSDYIWYTLGTQALLTNGKPLEETYWHGQRPYVIGYSVLETHKVYPPGVSRLTRDIQGELNENANQRSDNVKFAMNKRYFAKRGAQVDLRSLTRNVPSGVTLMNIPGGPNADVQIVDTKDVTKSAYEEQDRLNQDFDQIAGSFSPTGNRDAKDLANKVGGAELLTEDGDELEAYQLRTWVETWVEPTLYQVMLLEQHYETDQDILALCGKKAKLGENNGPTEITDQLLMQELALTVHVGIGATSPKMQLQNLIYGFASIVNVLEKGVLDKYGLEPAEFINEVFSKLGYKDGSRFFDWETQDPQVAALQQQIQQLQQALDAKEDPAIIAAKVRKLDAEVKKINSDAFEGNVRGMFGAMEAAEVVTAVPDVAPAADMIVKAAGFMQPVPAGIDPGFDSAGPAQAASGLSIDPVKNKHTGIGFTPGSAAQAAGIQQSTDPLSPKMPASPMTGANKGIESNAQLHGGSR